MPNKFQALYIHVISAHTLANKSNDSSLVRTVECWIWMPEPVTHLYTHCSPGGLGK